VAGDAGLRALLDAYEARDEREARDVRRLAAAIDSVDLWSRASPLHVTGSALILHPPTGRVLLRWHTRMRAWMQVGGHFDPGETDPWVVARREAEEETGLTDLVEFGPAGTTPVQIVIVPVPARHGEPAHEHADIRFLLVTERPDDACPETSDAAVRWVTVADALGEVEEENLRELLRRAAERV
jgi:8-oxo-dGTP pyrophosphatase MutT (NUDIX family)